MIDEYLICDNGGIFRGMTEEEKAARNRTKAMPPPPDPMQVMQAQIDELTLALADMIGGSV